MKRYIDENINMGFQAKKMVLERSEPIDAGVYCYPCPNKIGII